MGTREAIMACIFVAPMVILFLSFSIYPTLFSFYVSFFKYEWLRPEVNRFVGLANYAEALREPLLLTGFKNAWYWTVLAMPVAVLYPLAVSVILHRQKRTMTFFRVVYYVPSVIGGAIWAVIWLWMYNPNVGMINTILHNVFRLKWSQSWLTDPAWAMPALVLTGITQLGGAVILFLTGLSSIPDEVREAASVDGASGWRLFFSITLPLLKPVLIIVSVPALAGSLQTFGTMWLMTYGGPGHATYSYVLHAYKTAFEYGYRRMGYASAQLWLLAIVITGVSLVQFRILRSERM
ncbi:MAG: sugar ABC transporter permease [Firmicutes bacterium]|nr:sugar ABC transporter permease [Bacillota bacterium]